MRKINLFLCDDTRNKKNNEGKAAPQKEEKGSEQEMKTINVMEIYWILNELSIMFPTTALWKGEREFDRIQNFPICLEN